MFEEPQPAPKLEDIPSIEALIHEVSSRPEESFELGYRQFSLDRPLFSANDWYGLGVLSIVAPAVIAKKRCRWYCGKAGAYEQFNLGAQNASASRM